ncbi:hypothetical protein SAMN04488128_102867 [Chitinophaga eiseniae]|uniref:Uncharacterized protein n=1 Tax=Chitinophaga eiseniae TaxID=634771 RepID=A0A1T4R686_9BACT|nr:hypothetical protein SAMN04488128_102867 [Chitinophaga eiseniae]
MLMRKCLTSFFFTFPVDIHAVNAAVVLSFLGICIGGK